MDELYYMPHKKLLILLFTFLLTLGAFGFVHAQLESLTVEITKPSEGETLYAGPETLVYSINIEGRVAGVDDPTAVEVKLEIIQGSIVIQSVMTIPDEEGLFIFPTTVNPEGSEPNFTAVEVEAGCENCHYRANLDLPSKSMLIRVIAKTSDGQEATAEREITVDLSDYTTVPIMVTFEDSPEKVLHGVTVQGSARLYEWRARHPSALTDENGIAQMRVEVLTEAPTRYIFQVVPTIIDGVLYQGIEAKDITIPPGATSTNQITLQAFGTLGSFSGRFYSSKIEIINPINLWAIHLPDGRSYQTTSDVDGQFKFTEIPYGSYLITIDAWELAKENLFCENQLLDLTQSTKGSILLAVRQINGFILRGTVVDKKGGSIPFAQITVEGLRRSQRTLPGDGTWTLFNLPEGSLTLTVSAPGYFSTKTTVSVPILEKGDPLQLELQRRPEIKTLEWGDGEVIIPPETDAIVEADQIHFNQGWLWGTVDGQEPLSIITPTEDIILENGSFGLEVSTVDHSWFYLWQGQAMIERMGDGLQVEVHGGEMVVLSPSSKLIPIPIDPVIDAGFHSDSQLLISPVWEQTLGEQIKSKLSSFSTSVIQIVTIITYIIALLLLVLLPVWALIRWRRNR